MRRTVGPLPLLLLLAQGPAFAAETAIPPPPQRWVTDQAAFLSPGTVAQLDTRLEAYEHATGHQLLVYIAHTTGGVPIEDWAVRAFERWRVGRRGIDDGLALFVFADDRRVRIEVGYGLEGRVPDVVSKRIIEERILPRIRAGDRDGAIRGGVDALLGTLGGEVDSQGRAVSAGDQSPVPPRPALWKLIVGALAIVGLIAFAITHPALAWLLLLSIGSGRGGGGRGMWGGGGGGGGGFSGGGGRSGGGGASGSW